MRYFITHGLYFLLLSSILSTCFNPVFSQNFSDKSYYLIDSLNINNLSVTERQLIHSALIEFHEAKHDTIKINAINRIVEESWNDFVWPKYNEWLYAFIQEKIKENSLNENKNTDVDHFLLKNKSSTLNNFGVYYFIAKDYEKSIEFYLRSLSLKKRINDQKGIASVYNNLGGIYDNKGNSPKALEYYLKSLEIRENTNSNDLKGLGISLNNVGQSYYNQGEIEKAKYYFQRSLDVNPDAKDDYAKASVLNNIGVIYSIENDYEKALKYFQESLQIKKNIGDKNGVVISLNSIGILYKDKGDYNKALDYFTNSLALSRRNKNIEGQAISLNNLADLNLLNNKIDEAKIYGNESMLLAKETKKPALISDAAHVLNKIYKKEGKWKPALTMHELYVKMRDSIRNRETEKDLIRQNAAYDLGKKEYEIELLSAQNEVNKLKLQENRNFIYFISAAFLFTLILAITIYYGYQKKQVINELLKQQKADISSKNEEKEIMLKEIHHRVKNNLQVVNSLLRFQARNITDKNVSDIFEIVQNRVLSMAMLHEKMYLSDDLKHISSNEHFTELIKGLIDNYTVGKHINLNLDIDDIPIDISVLTPLGLIICELITNAVKYGFVNKNEGEIKVSLKQLPTKKIELIISDNGIGYNSNDINEGLGTKLVRIYVKQLKGKLDEITQKGTGYKLVF